MSEEFLNRKFEEMSGQVGTVSKQVKNLREEMVREITLNRQALKQHRERIESNEKDIATNQDGIEDNKMGVCNNAAEIKAIKAELNGFRHKLVQVERKVDKR